LRTSGVAILNRIFRMRIPLFPLPNLVLFPQVVVPLHIFEDRYKLMINRAIDHDEAFGIALLGGPGEETEETIHRVGVTARVVEVQRLADERLDIVCAAETRFRITEFLGKQPYWTASVEVFEDIEEPAELLRAGYDEVARLYRHAVELSVKLRGSEVHVLPMPDSPSGLSNMMAYILDIPPQEKQLLLETVSTSGRLTSLVRYLDNTISQIQRQITKKKAGGNGHLESRS
jgi:ATP-dependent Lon protease